MTAEDFIKRAKALRAAAEAAEERFLAFLWDGEQQKDIWAPTGMTFLEFIERSNLCRATRYDAYRRVRGNLGKEEIEGVGVEPIIAAASLPNPKDQREVIERAKVSVRTNGTTPSEQASKSWAKEIKDRNAGSSAVLRNGGTMSYAALSEENEKLKSRVAELEQETAALRAEMKKLKKSAKTAPAVQKRAEA